MMVLRNPTRDVSYIADCRAEHATDKALLVVLPDGAKVWIPHSVVHDDSEVYERGDEGTLAVESWFARKKGLA